MRRVFTKPFFTVLAVLVVGTSFAKSVSSLIVPKEAIVPKEVKATNIVGEKVKEAPELKELSQDMLKMKVDEFLALTPSKYKEMTGQKLGLKKSLELKAAQKAVKSSMSSEGSISKGLYILLAIVGLGWVALGILNNWKGNDWIVNLVLTLLCWLPGVIHAFIKMKDYYK